MRDDPLYAFGDALDSMLEEGSEGLPERLVRAQMDDALTWQWVDVEDQSAEGWGRYVAEVMLEVREVLHGKRIQTVVYARSYSPEQQGRNLSGTSASEVWDYAHLVSGQIERHEIERWLWDGLKRGWDDARSLRDRLKSEIYDDLAGDDRQTLDVLAGQLRKALGDHQAR